MQLEAEPLRQAAQWVEKYRKFWEGSLAFATIPEGPTGLAFDGSGNLFAAPNVPADPHLLW
jgi:hypothetical protein